MASVPDGADRSNRRGRYWAGLAAVLCVALGLRLWGITQGLPYAYNSDENAHYLPRAIGMFGHSLNPEYFANPPALTYLLHFLLAVWFGGAGAVGHAYAAHPAEVWILARASVAVLGTLAVWLLYATGTRLFHRGVGLTAALLEAVAFLPVFYSHLALNDVPTLAPLTLCLLGSAGVLRKGRTLDYLVAGIGLGLGCATKYTAGIAGLVLLGAAAARFLEPSPGAGRRAVVGVAIAAAAALAAFIAADPYSVLDFSALHAGIVHQSTLSSEAQGKLGAPKESGVLYYLWALTWGLGWLPSLAALAGALSIWRSQRALAWMLVPTPILFLAFMGLQGRYFGRWLMPILPILCLLAAYFALRAAAWAARVSERSRSRRWLKATLVGLAVCALCAQGLIYSVHSGLVLSRAYTANLTRGWMIAHIPRGSQVVLEPVAPAEWVLSRGAHGAGELWSKYPSLRRVTAADGTLQPGGGEVVGIEDYERTLSPALIGHYEQGGYCWVITGSTQSARALADPKAVPQAIAYYRALAQQGEVLFHVSPYTPASKPEAFNFDWSFDYYPLSYQRPGPEMTVYRLRGGRCASSGPRSPGA
ncbi:MAG TPA: glycosyltransferase family 39 protein [Solirubrobacteraceae bacterium]